MTINNEIEPEEVIEDLEEEGLLIVKNEQAIRKSLCEICWLMEEYLGDTEKEYLGRAATIGRSKLLKVSGDNDSDAWAMHNAATDKIKKDVWRAIVCCFSSLEPEYEIPNVITICIDYITNVLGDDVRNDASRILIDNFSGIRKSNLGHP